MALLPLVNKVTGPIYDSSTNPSVNASAEDSWWLGSSSGSGSGLGGNLTGEVANETLDYCGGNVTDELEVHSDSVTRVPFKIWIALVLLFGSIATVRYTCSL